jgi:hypothetical protein
MHSVLVVVCSSDLEYFYTLHIYRNAKENYSWLIIENKIWITRKLKFVMSKSWELTFALNLNMLCRGHKLSEARRKKIMHLLHWIVLYCYEKKQNETYFIRRDWLTLWI